MVKSISKVAYVFVTIIAIFAGAIATAVGPLAAFAALSMVVFPGMGLLQMYVASIFGFGTTLAIIGFVVSNRKSVTHAFRIYAVNLITVAYAISVVILPFFTIGMLLSLVMPEMIAIIIGFIIGIAISGTIVYFTGQKLSDLVNYILG